MPKRKRKTALPRVTILAMSRRELVEFVTAYQCLAHQVRQLQELVEELRTRCQHPPRRKASSPKEGGDV